VHLYTTSLLTSSLCRKWCNSPGKLRLLLFLPFMSQLSVPACICKQPSCRFLLCPSASHQAGHAHFCSFPLLFIASVYQQSCRTRREQARALQNYLKSIKSTHCFLLLQSCQLILLIFKPSIQPSNMNLLCPTSVAACQTNVYLPLWMRVTSTQIVDGADCQKLLMTVHT